MCVCVCVCVCVSRPRPQSPPPPPLPVLQMFAANVPLRPRVLPSGSCRLIQRYSCVEACSTAGLNAMSLWPSHQARDSPPQPPPLPPPPAPSSPPLQFSC